MKTSGVEWTMMFKAEGFFLPNFQCREKKQEERAAGALTLNPKGPKTLNETLAK